MADLRMEDPKTTKEFVSALESAGVKLPLQCSPLDIGVILDLEGRDVVTVDVNGIRPDDEVCLIADWIVLAVNTCGGFKAEIDGDA